MKFYSTLYQSGKNIISNLRRIQEKDCRSNFGSNIKNICRFNNTTDILACAKDSVQYFPISLADSWRVHCIKELISIKDNIFQLEGFLPVEIDFLIENLACT